MPCIETGEILRFAVAARRASIQRLDAASVLGRVGGTGH
jgi:hypothetical protein